MKRDKEYAEEINLYDLWKVIVKRAKLIIGLFIISVASATVISFLMPKIYQGNAVLLVQPAANITAKEITDIIGIIDEDKRHKMLSKTLDSVMGVKLSAIKESKDKIDVSIEAIEISAIQPALSEIINYVNNIELVKSNVEDERERLLFRSVELSSVVKESKGLLQAYDELLKVGKLVPVGFNPIELNKRISDIKAEKLVAEQTLKRLNGSGIEIAKQIDIKSYPVKPSKRTIVSLTGVASILMSIFLAFFLEFVDKVRNDRGSDS